MASVASCKILVGISYKVVKLLELAQYHKWQLLTQSTPAWLERPCKCFLCAVSTAGRILVVKMSMDIMTF